MLPRLPANYVTSNYPSGRQLRSAAKVDDRAMSHNHARHIIVPPENLEQVATLIGKHPEIAALRFIAELLFKQRVQSAVAAPQVDRLGGQVDFGGAAAQSDHRRRSGLQALEQQSEPVPGGLGPDGHVQLCPVGQIQRRD
jgi:hypothetical protein